MLYAKAMFLVLFDLATPSIWFFDERGFTAEALG
jgi:hypothetical protein